MTTNTKTALRTIADWTITDPANMDAVNMAEIARAALTTAAAVPPEGVVMVPVELAERVHESLGEFLMDHGWSQRDMDTSDDFGAVLLAADPKAEPVPAGWYPPLQKITSEDRSFLHYNPNTDDVVEWVQNYARCCIDADRAARAAQPLPAGEYLPLPRKAGLDDHSILPEPGFSADQMHAYVDADRAMRAQAAPAVAAADVLEQIANEPPINGNNLAAARVMMAAQMLRDQITEAAAAPQPAVQQGETLVRYCPGCGSVGPAEAKYRDCCPDGNEARMIPQALARKCHDTFQLATNGALATQPAAPVAQRDAEDAARYRWLREQGALAEDSRHPHSWRCVALLADMGGDYADAAIDTARSQAKEGQSYE